MMFSITSASATEKSGANQNLTVSFQKATCTTGTPTLCPIAGHESSTADPSPSAHFSVRQHSHRCGIQTSSAASVLLLCRSLQLSLPNTSVTVTQLRAALNKLKGCHGSVWFPTQNHCHPVGLGIRIRTAKITAQ